MWRRDIIVVNIMKKKKKTPRKGEKDHGKNTVEKKKDHMEEERKLDPEAHHGCH